MREQPSAARPVTIEAFQCPKHKHFTTLVVNDTRFGASKCCPIQYRVKLAEWHLRAAEARELVEHIERALEEHDG